MNANKETNQDGGMSRQDLQEARRLLGGTLQLARCVDSSLAAMKNYLYSATVIPPDLADKIRKCLPSPPSDHT